jgi:hypothetical protein
MNTFNETLKNWQVFYSTASAVSATLTGLLFVALSINIKRFKKPKNSYLLQIARRTFGDYLYVLMIGLVFLVPDQIPAGFSLALLVLAVSRGIGLIHLAIDTHHSARKSDANTHIIREFALPAVACLGLIIVAASVMAGYNNAPVLLVIVVAALLASASWSAWVLLINS